MKKVQPYKSEFRSLSRHIKKPQREGASAKYDFICHPRAKKKIKKRREKILVRLHGEVATASSKREIPEMLCWCLED
jgi:hypothetical protein